jgi:hypothetical protein
MKANLWAEARFAKRLQPSGDTVEVQESMMFSYNQSHNFGQAYTEIDEWARNLAHAHNAVVLSIEVKSMRFQGQLVSRKEDEQLED